MEVGTVADFCKWAEFVRKTPGYDAVWKCKNREQSGLTMSTDKYCRTRCEVRSAPQTEGGEDA